MDLYKLSRDKVIKGSVITFTILLLIMFQLVLTACSHEQENIQEDIDTSGLSEISNELDKPGEITIEYQDVLTLSGQDSDEGIILNESAKDQVTLPSVFGYVRNLMATLKNNEINLEDKQVVVKYAIENEWLPNDYTDAMWANPISRGEAMYILTKALNIKIEKVWNYEYKDIAGDKYEAEIYAALIQGYIQGFSTGNFKPDSALSVKEMNIILENVGKSYEERIANWKFAPDGRKIRETNLPDNAEDFEYILADTSNEYYESCGVITKETGAYIDLFTKEDRVGMIKPKDLTKELSDIPQFKVSKDDENYKAVMAEWHPYQSTIYSKSENFDMVLNRYKAYFEHCTNVDYRTIDDEWALELYLILYPHLNKELYYKNQPADGSRNIWEQYVDYVKEHKIVLKSNRIQVEKSAVYHMNNYMVVRAYVDFDVVNFENIGDSQLYLITAGNTMGDIPLDKVVKGNYSGYVNNVLRMTMHATKETDFIFAPTNESGIGRAVMLNTFSITSDVG